MVEKEIVVAGIVKLTTIITLKESNGQREVGIRIFLEIHKHSVHIGFAAKRKGPHEMRVVIHDYKIKLKPGNARDR